MAENSLDVALLGRIAATERKLLATCDLIPLANWGFDDSIHEKLRQQRNKLVNEHLTKKQKKSFSSAQKGRFARTIGVASTVSEVLDWMSTTTLKDVQPKAAKLNQKPVEKKEKPAVAAPKKEKVAKAAPASESSSEDESDSEDEAPEPAAAVKKPAAKPVATVKPTVRAETEKEAEDSEEEKMDEGEDSTDEEMEEVVPKGAQKRKAVAEPAAPAKKSKVDKELEKYEKIDPVNLDPIESRKVAMLKLQKKIEAMKLTRVGKKKAAAGGGGKAAAEAESERKMKRRMSKLQLKQRRAEEKNKQQQKDKGEKPEPVVKQEDLPRNEEGKVVYSKFDFIVKDPKKRLTTKEKKDKFTGKDYKSLLNKVEKRDEKLKQLREKDPEKAREMEEEIKWNRALKKAEGVKVKDNKELLKKGLKNKEKAKEKRLEKWSQREQKVSADKTKKQDKRQTNLQKRVDSKKKTKMAKLRAKGRIL